MAEAPGRDGLLALLCVATLGDRWVRATFARRFSTSTRRIAPYGLVSKTGEWHLVWADEEGHVHVDVVSAIRTATLVGARFERPDDFDVQAFWAAWRDRELASRPGLDIRLRVRKDAEAYVRDALGERRGIYPRPTDDASDWVEMTATFALLEEARRKLLALGGAVEVLAPNALRASVEDFANQICNVCATSAARPDSGRDGRRASRFGPPG